MKIRPPINDKFDKDVMSPSTSYTMYIFIMFIIYFLLPPSRAQGHQGKTGVILCISFLSNSV